MIIKKVFKLSPLRLLSLFLLYFTLYILHVWCQPILTINKGLTTPCGLFSEWIWNNPFIYDMYNKINNWHILIITIFLIIMLNLSIEVIQNNKKNKPRL